MNNKRERIIKKIIDVAMQGIRDNIENLITIAFDEWEIEDLERVIKEED